MKRLWLLILTVSQFETTWAQTPVVAKPQDSVNFKSAEPVRSMSSAKSTTIQPANVPLQVAPPPPTGSQPAGQPVIVPIVTTPNISSNESKESANQLIQNFMNMLSGQSGAPSQYLPNGQPNPAYRNFVGGPTSYDGAFGPPANNGDYSGLSNLHITNIEDAKRYLKSGHRCSEKDTNRLVCMVCNLYFEAGNEPREAQLAVGRSVMTRVFSGAYEDTVCKNVYKNNGKVAQYSWTLENKDHTLPNSTKIDDLIAIAAQSLREGPNGLTNYYNYNLVNPPWGQGGECYRTRRRFDGSQHQFCSIRGTATRTIAEVAAAEGLSYSEVQTDGSRSVLK